MVSNIWSSVSRELLYPRRIFKYEKELEHAEDRDNIKTIRRR